MKTKLMDRIIIKSTSEIAIDLVPEPVLRAGEVLVQTLVSGVCGSDIHASHGRHPFVPLPYKPGHEVVGIIKELSPGVKNFSIGDRITVEPTLPCWDCKHCRAGNENLCENLAFFGCGYEQGGMADLFTIPANRLHLIPANFSDEEAALVEPLATPVHAVRLAIVGLKDLSDKNVVIFGCGTIGLLTLITARHFKAKKIVVTDLLSAKRERALRLGADAAVDAAASDLVGMIRTELGESADIVFDCVAIQATVTQAIQLADKAGSIMIVGVPGKEVTIPLPVIQDHQIQIQGSATYLPTDYLESIKIIENGEVNVQEIVTSIFPKDEARAAFAAASAGDQVKVLIRFS
jgi:2-desacetyl-2-hydroxyethyl bacteriochlorophyllide A dehydrogenase